MTGFEFLLSSTSNANPFSYAAPIGVLINILLGIFNWLIRHSALPFLIDYSRLSNSFPILASAFVVVLRLLIDFTAIHKGCSFFLTFSISLVLLLRRTLLLCFYWRPRRLSFIFSPRLGKFNKSTPSSFPLNQFSFIYERYERINWAKIVRFNLPIFLEPENTRLTHSSGGHSSNWS